MKRDMKLVTELLLVVEERGPLELAETAIEGYTNEQIRYHAVILTEAGYLMTGLHTECCDKAPGLVTAQRLTWQGHEYLDSLVGPRL